jgi:hypothetical protein
VTYGLRDRRSSTNRSTISDFTAMFSGRLALDAPDLGLPSTALAISRAIPPGDAMV